MPKGGRSRSLTREEIVDEALELLRSEGMSGLTMRAVSTKLGVTPMAVYYYIADKDELVRKVVDRISSEWGLLTSHDGDWESELRTHLMAVWRQSTRYPGLSAYLIDQPTMGVTEDRLAAGLRFFEDAGFDTETAPLAWSFAMTYIHGRISVDAKLGHRPEAPHIEGLHANDYVEFGLDAVIAGLRALLDSQSARAGKDVRRPAAVRRPARRLNAVDAR